jgi:hypothetical protein
MQLQAFSTRIYIVFALSLFFISATYLFWTGGHERFISSFHPKTPVVNIENPLLGDEKEEPWHAPPIETVDEGTSSISSQTVASSPSTSTSTSANNPTPTDSPIIDDGEILIMDEFDGAPIKAMCDQTTWKPAGETIIGCGARVGGVGRFSSQTPIMKLIAAGNVRQEILVCVRHAIEIGAGLIRPTVMLRSDNIIEYQHGPVRNMSYLFELEKFDERLKASCPQMRLYEDDAEVEALGDVVRILKPRILDDDGNKDWNGFRKWAEENQQEKGKITVLDVDLVFGQTYVVCLPVANDANTLQPGLS